MPLAVSALLLDLDVGGKNVLCRLDSRSDNIPQRRMRQRRKPRFTHARAPHAEGKPTQAWTHYYCHALLLECGPSAHVLVTLAIASDHLVAW